ncbi:MAG: hypothetical protein MRY21_01180 [Simkaniaceae bacterium]|nr:hypothetical protein [Simkaniaceae bacterium]
MKKKLMIGLLFAMPFMAFADETPVVVEEEPVAASETVVEPQEAPAEVTVTEEPAEVATTEEQQEISCERCDDSCQCPANVAQATEPESTCQLTGDACQCEKPLKSEPKLIELSELTPEILQNLAAGEANVVVHFPAETQLPVSFNLTGNMVTCTTAETHNMLSVQSDLYVRCGEQGLEMSKDLEIWKPFNEFFQGCASVCLQVGENGPVATLHLNLQN